MGEAAGAHSQAASLSRLSHLSRSRPCPSSILIMWLGFGEQDTSISFRVIETARYNAFRRMCRTAEIRFFGWISDERPLDFHGRHHCCSLKNSAHTQNISLARQPCTASVSQPPTSSSWCARHASEHRNASPSGRASWRRLIAFCFGREHLWGVPMVNKARATNRENHDGEPHRCLPPPCGPGCKSVRQRSNTHVSLELRSSCSCISHAPLTQKRAVWLSSTWPAVSKLY